MRTNLSHRIKMQGMNEQETKGKFMFRNGVPRRVMIKGVLKAGVYSAPVILSVATAHGVAAVSPPVASGGGTVTFLRSGIVQGTGFAANTPFLLILFNPPESGFNLLQPVLTDMSGNFILDAGAGVAPAPHRPRPQ